MLVSPQNGQKLLFRNCIRFQRELAQNVDAETSKALTEAKAAADKAATDAREGAQK